MSHDRAVPGAASRRRPATTTRALLTILVVALAAVAIRAGTYAKLLDNTLNAGDSFTAGTVNVTDNDLGSWVVSLAGAGPGGSTSGCIQVTYSGTLNSTVALYGSATGALAPYVDLTVTRGTVGTPVPAFPSCSTFTPDASPYLPGGAGGVVYSGPLSSFPASYAAAALDPGRPYSSGVLATSGVVSYWRLGESAGATTAADSAGTNNGTYQNGLSTTIGAPGAVTSEINTAATFDGVDDRVLLPAISAGVTFTVEAWVKTTTTAQRPVWSNRSTGGTLYAGVTGGKLFVYDARGVPSAISATSTRSVNDNKWHHVAFTSDSFNSYLYVDGALDTTIGKTRNSSSGVAYIGWDATAVTEYLPGSVDEVAIYSTALTAAQVQARYVSGGPENWSPGEVHAYKLAVTLQNNAAAQGLSGSASFTWEARNQ